MDKTSNIKVFSVNDCDWYVAETLEDAVECAISDCGDEDYIEDPHELSDEEMKKLNFHGEKKVDTTVEPISHLDDLVHPRFRWETYECTFEEELQRLIDIGEKFPCMFASTEY